jgi:hypothetical protein
MTVGSDASRVPSAPSVGDIQRIVAIESPVVRNLEITYCYSRLAAACVTRNGEGANWCTYATWASRQAGRTIRGEDLLANLEIGLHEQTRLQPQILEALDAASATQQDLGRRALDALVPSATRWWPVVRGPAAAASGTWARAIQRAATRLAREAITDSLMVLALPGRMLALGTHLADAYPDELVEPADRELNELLARFEPVAPAPDDCGARDWSDLDQRMHYIVHLFRAFHLYEQLSQPPFNPDQVTSIVRGIIPEGEL